MKSAVFYGQHDLRVEQRRCLHRGRGKCRFR